MLPRAPVWNGIFQKMFIFLSVPLCAELPVNGVLIFGTRFLCTGPARWRAAIPHQTKRSSEEELTSV